MGELFYSIILYKMVHVIAITSAQLINEMNRKQSSRKHFVNYRQRWSGAGLGEGVRPENQALYMTGQLEPHNNL